MKLKFLLLSILLGVFFITILSTCSKDEDKTLQINGNISDGNQHIPVKDAVVTFWVSRIQNGTYNPNLTPLISLNTDENGNYSFNVSKDKDAAYRITVEKEKYFSLTTDYNVDDLPSGTHNLNYSILPEAYFKMHVANTTPIDNNDMIGYYISSNQPSVNNCCNNQTFTGLGYFYNYTHICKTYGAQQIKINWTVKKNNFISYYDTAIYCLPFDTTLFNLNY